MSDDDQTAAAGLLANQTVTEPRSAVEAASDPSHGGAPIYDSGWRSGDPSNGGNVGQRTIKAGVERLDGLKKRVADMLEDVHGFVAAMEGKAEHLSPTEWQWTQSPDTAGRIHDAVFDMEGLFDKMADLVKRAKAAHG